MSNSSFYEPTEGYKSYYSLNNDLPKSCCCQTCNRQSESCASAMRSHKSYLALILVPYLILIAVFHTQLQVYDGGGHKVLHNNEESFHRAIVDQQVTYRFRDLMLKQGTVPDKQTSAVQQTKHERRENLKTNDMKLKLDFKSKENNSLHKTMISSQSKNDTYLFGNVHSQSICEENMKWNSLYPISRQCCNSVVIKAVPKVPFQPVQKHWVYTAYLDKRVSQMPQVRVIMLLKKVEKQSIYCHFPKHDKVNLTTATEKDFISVIPGYYEMCENHAKDYGGWILSCIVPFQIKVSPCWIVISLQPKYIAEKENVQVPVFITDDKLAQSQNDRNTTNDSRQEFGVCIPPIFGYIPSTTLVEFIEMTRLLGASHMVFYLHQVSREIQKVLSYYAAQTQLVTVISWDLPVSDKHIWYHGQLLAINDCLYRGMHRFKYLAFNDLDEFIIPHSKDARNWTDMIKAIQADAVSNKHDLSNHCGYSFQSAFFDPLSSGSRVLYDLESDLRTKSLSNVRTKTMVHPERMFELGIHHMSRPINDKYIPYSVQPSQAYIHHYRKCVTDFDPRMNCQVYAKDESLSPFIPSLRHNVHQVLWTLKEIEKRHTWRGR